MSLYMIGKKIIIVVATILIFSGSVKSAVNRENNSVTLPQLDENAGVDDYLRYAALNNAGLEADFNRWKADLEQVPQAGALPDPRFNYTYFIEEVETRVGPQQQKFGLAQQFPWFGKRRLRADAATQAANVSEAIYEKNKLKLFYRVKSAYHEYWYLKQAIAITKEHVRLVSNMEGVARTRFKAGTAPNNAVIQAQVELGKLDDRLRTLEDLRKPIVATLDAALNLPESHQLPWPHSLPETTVAFTDEQAMLWLKQNNPDLMRLAYSSKKAEVGIKLAHKEYFPDITLGVDYVDTGEALDSSLTDSGKDPVMAMVSVNLPIWYGKYRAAGREAKRRKASVDASRVDTERRLEANLTMALYYFRDAERKIDLFGDTLVPKAEQSLQVTQQGFETGRTSFIALLDAERLLLEFQLSHNRAQADRGKRLAEIEMLVGGNEGDNVNKQNRKKER